MEKMGNRGNVKPCNIEINGKSRKWKQMKSSRNGKSLKQKMWKRKKWKIVEMERKGKSRKIKKRKIVEM